MATKPIPFGQGFHKSDCSSPSTHQDIAAPTAEQDVLIDIYPRGYDSWVGTSAQLIAEGLIPDGFGWPRGAADMHWNANGFDYWLRRTRPEGHKGPMRSWLEIDHWCLRRTLSSKGRDGFTAARIHEKRVALEEELWRSTPAYREQWRRYWAAHEDKAFQRLKALIVPEQKKRGRKPQPWSPTPPASA